MFDVQSVATDDNSQNTEPLDTFHAVGCVGCVASLRITISSHLQSNEYIILLTFQRNFALGSIPDEIFPIQACNFLRSNNHPIKRCSIVVVYVISTRAKNVRKWIRFRHNTMRGRNETCIFEKCDFLGKFRFFLRIWMLVKHGFLTFNLLKNSHECG